MANEHLETLRLAVPRVLSKTGELTVRLHTGESSRGFKSSHYRLRRWAQRIREVRSRLQEMLALQKEADACPERFRNAAEVAGAIRRQYNGIIGVPLTRLVTCMMKDSWAVEELYERLRLPGAPSAVMVNKMFGADRYFRISKGRRDYLIRLSAESRAFQVCKQREREQRLALSWEKIALTFYGDD